MHPRNFVFITVMTLCHLQLAGQLLTNALPPAQNSPSGESNGQKETASSQLPDDPGQEAIPLAKPEPAPTSGVPLRWDAGLQTWAGDTVTLSEGVVVY